MNWVDRYFVGAWLALAGCGTWAAVTGAPIRVFVERFGVVHILLVEATSCRAALRSLRSGITRVVARFGGASPSADVKVARRAVAELLEDLAGIAPSRPEFQPAPQSAATAILLWLGLALSLPAPGLAQSGTPAASPDSSPDVRATLGDCPADLLRRAWTEMLPLEAEAVEREVLALCTERSEAIKRFLDAQAGLDGALAVLRAPAPAAGTPSAADSAAANDRLERLRTEIAALRGRIARLEGEPERPETEASLAELRAELAAAEAGLARAEEAAGVLPPASGETGAAGDETPPAMEFAAPGPGTTPDSGLPGDPSASPAAAAGSAIPIQPAAGDVLHALLPPGTPSDAPASATPQVSGDLPPPGASPAGPHFPASAAAEPGSGLLSEGPTDWRVVHAVRRDGGPWHVLLQGAREIEVRIPGATPEDPDIVRWQPVVDPPVALAVGDSLPDGRTLLAVTPEGVTLAGPATRHAQPVLVPFATAEDSAPGTLDWDFETIGKDD